MKDCLFRAFKLTKNADPGKYSYSGYRIRFDWKCAKLLAQGLNDATITIEAKYSINFTRSTVSYLLMPQKYINSKQKTHK